MVELALLGPVGLTMPERFVQVGSPRGRAVLAALALTRGHELSRDRLHEVAWGGGETSSGSAVTVTVHRLRRWLRDMSRDTIAVETTPKGYRLDLSGGDLDVHRFRRLVRDGRAADGAERVRLLRDALACWRGPAAQDIPEDCVDPAAVAELAMERRRVTVELARALLGSTAPGAAEQALRLVSPLVEQDVWDESAQAVWITALAGTGRQAEALAGYHHIRRGLRAELRAEPGSELAAALSGVLRRAGPEVPALRRVPAQLPADIRTFVGRDAELETLTRLLGERVPAVLLTGEAGVGKSALAVRWAHRAASGFPGGQLYADLRGHSAKAPLPPEPVLGRFLRALGVPATAVPDDPVEAVALYRRLLARARALVVLDNVASAEQARPLLPPDGPSRAIVTARSDLPGLAAHRLALSILDEQDAVGLLAGMLGACRVSAEPEAARRLALACGRLPARLRTAAAHLLAPPHPPLSAYLARVS